MYLHENPEKVAFILGLPYVNFQSHRAQIPTQRGNAFVVVCGGTACTRDSCAMRPVECRGISTAVGKALNKKAEKAYYFK